MQDVVQSQPVSRMVCEHAMPAAKKEGEGGSTRSLANAPHHHDRLPLLSLPSALTNAITATGMAAATPLSGNNDGLKFLNILRGGEEKREEEGKTSFLRPAAGGRHEGQQQASRRVSEWRKGKKEHQSPDSSSLTTLYLVFT